MKKIFLFLAIFCAMFLQASTYECLTFTKTSGDVLTMSVKGLSLQVVDNQLHVSNSEQSVYLPLVDLVDMYFSGETTSLENVLNADAPVDVYNVLGSLLGRYESMLVAAKSLPAGKYVISNGIQSQTIVIQ